MDDMVLRDSEACEAWCAVVCGEVWCGGVNDGEEILLETS